VASFAPCGRRESRSPLSVSKLPKRCGDGLVLACAPLPWPRDVSLFRLNRASVQGQGRNVQTMVLFSLWLATLFVLILKWTPISALGITVTVPLTAPSSAPLYSRSLVSFSIEQDRWTDWVGQGEGNPLFFNTLNNLKQLTGEPARIRIGADSEDRTNFDPSVQVWLCLSSVRRK
jgi:hypothetical protein